MPPTHWELARAIEADRLTRQKDSGFSGYAEAVAFTIRADFAKWSIACGRLTDRVASADSSSSSERSER